MARHALAFRHRTSLCFRFSASVTRLALCIVIYRLRAGLRMRVVTCETTDARIVRVVAFALRETIRLETYVGNAGAGLHGDFRPCAVTLAAKIGGLLRR